MGPQVLRSVASAEAQDSAVVRLEAAYPCRRCQPASREALVVVLLVAGRPLGPVCRALAMVFALTFLANEEADCPGLILMSLSS